MAQTGADRCSVCLKDNATREAIEHQGRLALCGEISWREIGRTFEGLNPTSVKNHMERHFVTEVDDAMSETEDLLADTIRELVAQAKFMPAEVKPLYLIAIQNLKALKDTKPSQQHLINALKGIHEITNMKLEQRLMLQFGQAMFGEAQPAVLEAHLAGAKELEAGEAE